jgi:PST family polysaccharide transporter
MPDDPLADELAANAAPPQMTSTSTLGRIAVRVTIWTGIGTYLNQIIGFAATLVMTRLLDPSIFGTFSLATFWFTLLNLRPKSGISYAAIRQPESNGTLLGTYWGLDAVLAIGSLVLSIVTGMILLWLTTTLASFVYTPLMIASVVVLMLVDGLSVIVSPLSLILEKEMQLSRLTLVSLAAAVLAYGVAIVLALSGAGVGALLAVNVVTTAVSIAGVFIVCRRRWPQAFRWRWHFDRTLARRLVRQGLPIGLSLTALSSIVMQFDNFLIGTFVDAETLGYYDRAYRIASWPNILLTAIIVRVGFLTYVKVQNDVPRLTHAVKLTLWILMILGLPIALVLFFGAPDIVRVLYGPKWSESGIYLRFLTIYSMVWPLVNVGFWLSVALGHSRTTVLLTAIQAGVMILVGTPLTIIGGIGGTILGVSMTMMLSIILSTVYVFRQLPLSFYETYGAPLLAGAAAAALSLILTQWNTWPSLDPIVRLIILGLVNPLVCYAVIFALQPTLTRERVFYVLRLLRTPKLTGT